MRMGLGELGWSPKQFWSATLPELLAGYRGYWERERRADSRMAPLTTRYANVHRDTAERPEPYVFADFFPSLPRPREDDEEEDELDGDDE